MDRPGLAAPPGVSLHLQRPRGDEALGEFLFAHGRTGQKPDEGHEHVLVFSDTEWPEVSDLDEVELPDHQTSFVSRNSHP